MRCFSSNWLGVRPSSRALFSNRSKSSRKNLSIVDRDRENFRNSELAGFVSLGDLVAPTFLPEGGNAQTYVKGTVGIAVDFRLDAVVKITLFL